jgi:hypothetical protein
MNTDNETPTTDPELGATTLTPPRNPLAKRVATISPPHTSPNKKHK